MKSIIELAREAGFVVHRDEYLFRDMLEAFAALLKAEWLKEAGEMPEPIGTVYANYQGPWASLKNSAKENEKLVTVAQCREAVAAAVARKDAEHQQLTTEQVQRAKQALYEASHGDLEATDDEVKAAISVVLPYVWP